jgi:heme oxygenase
LDVRLIDRLNLETRAGQRELEAETFFRVVQSHGYRRFLVITYGFVAPTERALTTTPSIERAIDLRRFGKEELLRRDVISLGLSGLEINAIPQCAVPLFERFEEALGWAYVLERSTLAHHELFRRLASVVPGQVAFASTYLKCYVGTAGEMWRNFGDALDAIENESARELVVNAANRALQAHASWFQLRASASSSQPLPPTLDDAAES